MEDRRIAAAVRAIRIRRGWRQADLARAAGQSRASVSRLERGRLDELRLGAVRRIVGALDARIDVDVRWRGGDLARLVNGRHAAMHEAIARQFAELPRWTVEPEVSFSVYGERGVIDALAWDPARRVLLVIELKTELVDINDLMATIDRKRRLAGHVAGERGLPRRWRCG